MIDPDLTERIVQEILESISNTNEARYDIVKRFEDELGQLRRNVESILPDLADEAQVELIDKYDDDRGKVIEGLVRSILLTVYSSQFEQNTHVAYLASILEELYRMQKASAIVAEALSEKLEKDNQSKALPQEEWDSFNSEEFLRHVTTVSSIRALEKILSYNGVSDKTAEKILTMEIERKYLGRPKTLPVTLKQGLINTCKSYLSSTCLFPWESTFLPKTRKQVSLIG